MKIFYLTILTFFLSISVYGQTVVDFTAEEGYEQGALDNNADWGGANWIASPNNSRIECAGGYSWARWGVPFTVDGSEITFEIHFRFNIDRKFHELNYVDFTKTIKGQNIDKKLIGLNWITPENSRQFDMKFEIELLQNFKEIIKNDDKNKMVITNYSIFSSIGEKNISGFSRWYPGDNSAFPIKGNKYYETYKGFIISSLKKRKLKIYIYCQT